MRIKTLHLLDYCGYKDAFFNFRDFTCFVGPNGIGKTTILNAISLLTSSLDFKSDAESPGGFNKVTPEQRIQAFLRRNIRNIDDEEACKAFRAEAVFEHEGKDINVILTEKGFEKNELISLPFWWAGITYFAKFDSDMVNFQLRADLWPRFKKAYEGITGYEVEPELYTETELKRTGENADYAIGFFIKKPTGKIHSRKGSAGERKIAKSLSQVVNLEEARRPSIVLVDNIEMHVHYRRHLRMLDELKDLFGGMQIVSTTHSLPIIEKYEPKEDLIDIEEMFIKQQENL